MGVRVAYDFGSPVNPSDFLQHGWAYNSQGIRLLWLPITTVVGRFHAIRGSKGLSGNLSEIQFEEIRAFRHLVGNFAVNLRELARLLKICSVPEMHCPEDDVNLVYNARQRIPLHIDLAYVYIRRIADLFSRASRYVLFEHVDSAPCKFKNLIKYVQHGDIKKLSPICNVDLFVNAINSHSGWLDLIRKSERCKKVSSGLRDLMEHSPVGVNVRHAKVGGAPWEMTADLGYIGGSESFSVDLIKMISVIVEDVCALWSKVSLAIDYSCIDLQLMAQKSNILVLGDDEEITYFWPKIILSSELS
jgi:hypothetical protein